MARKGINTPKNKYIKEKELPSTSLNKEYLAQSFHINYNKLRSVKTSRPKFISASLQ